MKTYNYTYEIINVDESAKCMDVVYSCDGFNEVTVGVRLPFDGENIEDVIESASPVPMWEESTVSRVVPTVGQKGTKSVEVVPFGISVTDGMTDAEIVEFTAKQKLDEASYARATKTENGSVVINGITFGTSKADLLDLKLAIDELKLGSVASKNWKSKGGLFIELELADAESALSACMKFVQDAFDAEKAIVDAVNIAETVDQIKAITVEL